METYKLKLYIAGQNLKSERTVTNIRRICEQDLEGEYELSIIDLLRQPQYGESEKIMVTPTLVKEFPPPLRRIIGDLSDREKVLFGLDVLSYIPEKTRPFQEGAEIKELKTIDIKMKRIKWIIGTSPDILLKEYISKLDGVLDFRIQEILRDEIAHGNPIKSDNEILKMIQKLLYTIIKNYISDKDAIEHHVRYYDI